LARDDHARILSHGGSRRIGSTGCTVRAMARSPISTLLRAPAGPIDLFAVDARATPGFKKGKAAARKAHLKMAARVSTLQEQLYAEGRKSGSRSVLLVLQGMDTSGKGGTVRHVVGQCDPSGLHVATFGRPTPEELEHDFLWRIRRRLPEPGKLGVFDRSHYEDVLAARGRGVADRRTWGRRYRTINTFEANLVASGTRVVKCFLHISAEEQRARLLARLDDPTKHWKYNPGDLEDRALWAEYMAAYADALERCSTDAAPWHIVPADRKWYRNWAITQLLIEALEALDLRWPEADFDVEEERRRLLAIP
jgi:PPK2 family polyphosphate:nucleotide phosphotransferase